MSEVIVEETSQEVLDFRGAKEWEQIVCIHEAGHVFGCQQFGFPIEYVQMDFSLILGSLYGGHVHVLGEEEDRNPDNEAIMCFAGLAAEYIWHSIHGGEVDPIPSSTDSADGTRLLRERGSLSEPLARMRAERLVKDNWLKVETLAARLFAKKKLKEAHALAALKERRK